MPLKIAQFRYYGEKNKIQNNFPLLLNNKIICLQNIQEYIESNEIIDLNFIQEKLKNIIFWEQTDIISLKNFSNLNKNEKIEFLELYKNKLENLQEENTKESIDEWLSSYNFSNYDNIQKIIIQSIPGVHIYLNYLNYSPWNEGAPFIIGQSGNFEINIQDNKILKISNFKLDLNSKKIIDQLPNGHLIITIIYKE